MYELGGALGEQEVPPGTNLLLEGPALSGKTDVGYDVLRHGAENGEGSLVVTNRDSAERVRAERAALFEHDTPVGLVDCVTKHQGQGSIVDSEMVQYASSPDDMTGIGIKFSELLQDFYNDLGFKRNRALFVSVSTLLMYSNVQTVFRFLHVFTSRVENAGALGLYVIEADAHDDQATSTLSQLFDGVVRVDDDGSVDLQIG
jgi:KaiC/GvpD/RAD55 family RecA-like ATPase